MRLPFDEYDVRARAFPALLVSLPALALLYAALPSARNKWGAGAGTVLESAVLFFLARIARDRGAKLQPSLYELWGGPPTTRILRHRDSTLDPLTKARYKASLAKATGMEFPTPEVEQLSPDQADQVYGSAIRALLEQRRDKKHRLIFLENCNYGFARNLLGIKSLGMSLATVSVLADIWLYLTKGLSPALLIAAMTSLAVLLLLPLFVNRGFVERSANAYAEALLRSCEPGTPRAPAKPRKPGA